jgi:hypothetical protein
MYDFFVEVLELPEGRLSTSQGKEKQKKESVQEAVLAHLLV